MSADDADADSFVESLTDTSLYSIGAYFTDRHPELVEDVIADAKAIEDQGLEAYAGKEAIEVQQAFQTLMTGLAVRYFRAVAGEAAR